MIPVGAMFDVCALGSKFIVIAGMMVVSRYMPDPDDIVGLIIPVKL